MIVMRHLCVSNVYLMLGETYFGDFAEYLLVASRSWIKSKVAKIESESLIFQIRINL